MKRVLTSLFAVAATPAFAFDACLVGLWEVDMGDMAVVMQVQMGSPVTYVSGRMSIEVTEIGSFTLLAEGLTFKVAVPSAPAMDVTIEGYSAGAIGAAGDNTFEAIANDFSLVGTADIFGERMEIPITPADAPWGTAQGVYGCSEDSASFEPDMIGTFPREWIRVR